MSLPGTASGRRPRIGSVGHRHRRHASVEIVDAVFFHRGLNVEYVVRPVPVELGSDVHLREGDVEVTIDGVRCPDARSAYHLLADSSSVVGALSIPIQIHRSALLHIRFAPLAHTIGWNGRWCEALLQVRVAEIEPISARWVRPPTLTAGRAE